MEKKWFVMLSDASLAEDAERLGTTVEALKASAYDRLRDAVERGAAVELAEEP